VLFPPHEDAGIVPLEAQACGTPVIAFGRGGALDTVVEGKTGVFFAEQTPESLTDAIKRFEGMRFEGEEVRGHAKKFSAEKFRSRLREIVQTESVT
jgi:glycosyltransferase involved in cell wall biosynthesis